MSAPLKLMSSRMSPRGKTSGTRVSSWQVPPAVFTGDFFRVYVRQMSLKGQKCRGETCQDGVNMAYFRTCAMKERGQVFTRVGLLVDLYSVPLRSLEIAGAECFKKSWKSQEVRPFWVKFQAPRQYFAWKFQGEGIFFGYLLGSVANQSACCRLFTSG